MRAQLTVGNINNFLRHYWLSQHGVVKETQLLSTLQDYVKNEDRAYDFLAKISDEVDTYEALLKPTEEYWSRKDPEIYKLLSDLQIISAIIPIPLLMAAEAKLETKEFKQVIDYITIFIFRYLTVGEQESKVLEKVFSDIAIEIRGGKITKADLVKSRLLKHDISDKAFRELLITKDVKLNKVARYILEKVEFYLDPDMEKFSEKITLEHILPKKPDKDWEKYLDEHNMEHSTLVYKLGNMTLLLGKVNSKLKNKIFSKKRTELEKSSRLKINKDLKKIESWTGKDILKRQKWLTNICMEIWNFDAA